MKTFVGLFGASALFGIALAVAYWFVAHEEATGTVLLGCMAAALVFTAGYAVVAERSADLDGDDPNGPLERAAGEELGVFTTHSAWPILVASCSLLTLAGTLWSPALAVAAGIALILCCWRLGAESARV
ncbi:MAG: cytochrome c oxidase subunit 4 [Candidatus Eremiobacteraeota bacterium]|nr:cytochrome c oxidase subunit 4 [Candidatus Eremiobacteraeota bacterium]